VHSNLSSQILALLVFIPIVSLGIRGPNESAGPFENELTVQSPEIDHLVCNLGHPLSPCGFDAYPAGDLFIVEPSFG
jgi:hypothetical protein